MNWGLVLVPGGAGLLGLTLGFCLGRLGRSHRWARRLGYALFVALGVCVIGLMIAARANQGWDGMGYFIASFFMALPAAIGVGFGTWVGGR